MSYTGYAGGAYSVGARETKGSVARPEVDVVLSRWVWELMNQLGQEFSPQECGGLLVIEDAGWQESGRLRLNVVDLVFPEQEGSGGNVEWEETDEISFLKREDVGAWPGGEHAKSFPVWGKWHTHPSMGVFWSSTDESTLVKNSVGPGLLVNVVLDPSKGEVLSRVDCAVRSPDWPRGKYLWAEWPAKTLVERVQYDGMDEFIAEAKGKFKVKSYGMMVGGVGTPTGFVGESLAKNQHRKGKHAGKGGEKADADSNTFRSRARSLSSQMEQKIKRWFEPEDILWLSDDRMFRPGLSATFEIALTKSGTVMVRRDDAGVITEVKDKDFVEWWQVNFPDVALAKVMPQKGTFKMFHLTSRLGQAQAQAQAN